MERSAWSQRVSAILWHLRAKVDQIRRLHHAPFLGYYVVGTDFMAVEYNVIDTP